MKKDFEEIWMKDQCSRESLRSFEPLRTIGAGSFGRVVLARHKENNIFYALKMMDKEKVVKRKQIEHTLTEKNILSAIKMDFIVTLHYCMQDSTTLYFVLSYIPGGDMFNYLQKVGRLNEDNAKFYACQILFALEYLHTLQILYRDLKPENVMLDKNGYIRLTDLGFAKQVTERTWTLCGTPEYLAPEVILSKGYGKCVDWWAFGVYIYEMTAGYAPFVSDEPIQIYEKIVSGKVTYPTHFSTKLIHLLCGLLEVDVTRRLGNTHPGVAAIRGNKWFRKVEWIKIYQQQIPPPYVPLITSETDTSNFEKFAEKEMTNATTSNKDYKTIFANF
ncbi:hypothetical protein SNEBB_004287 [Seison nebaliae]|nr:hypothetical protein SNEBB_004287 [Seison nebaliae]